MSSRASSFMKYIIAFCIVLSLNFMLPRLMPGDPLTAIYGEDALVQMSPDLRARVEERFGIDKPLEEQFLFYLKELTTGDLGYSFYYNAPVREVILGSLPWSILLCGTSLAMSTFLGMLLGIESGWRRGKRWDAAALTGVILLNGIPDFFLGILLLMVFGVLLGIFPLSGALTPYEDLSGIYLVFDVLKHLALPLLALTLSNLAGTYLLTRSSMLAVLKAPFLTTARAKGLGQLKIRYGHAGRNILLPVITNTGTRFGRLAAGVIFVETVFAYPGLGQLLYNSLLTRDYPLIQGVLLVVTAAVLSVSFILDLLYTKLDPRVNYAH